MAFLDKVIGYGDVSSDMEKDYVSEFFVEAYESYGSDVCEIDVSDLSIDETINYVADVIFDKKEFPFGEIDFMNWLINC